MLTSLIITYYRRMYCLMKKIFLNDRFIFAFIVLNAIIIFIQETGINIWWINILDVFCTIIFLIEMVVKQKVLSVKDYWKDKWNCLDGILVILSFPSIFYYIWPNIFFNISFILVLRLLRVFRFLRIFHLFPKFETILRNIKIALKHCLSVFVGFGILLFVFAVVSCALFSQSAPVYFGTPLESLYSTFQIFTIEGWSEIPNAVASESAHWAIWPIRIYFMTILVFIGIIGVSIINSLFVDAMMSDNNKDVLEKLEQLDKKIDALAEK